MEIYPKTWRSETEAEAWQKQWTLTCKIKPLVILIKVDKYKRNRNSTKSKNFWKRVKTGNVYINSEYWERNGWKREQKFGNMNPTERGRANTIIQTLKETTETRTADGRMVLWACRGARWEITVNAGSQIPVFRINVTVKF